jgi:hypothetical protein
MVLIRFGNAYYQGQEQDVLRDESLGAGTAAKHFEGEQRVGQYQLFSCPLSI